MAQLHQEAVSQAALRSKVMEHRQLACLAHSDVILTRCIKLDRMAPQLRTHPSRSERRTDEVVSPDASRRSLRRCSRGWRPHVLKGVTEPAAVELLRLYSCSAPWVTLSFVSRKWNYLVARATATMHTKAPERTYGESSYEIDPLQLAAAAVSVGP